VLLDVPGWDLRPEELIVARKRGGLEEAELFSDDGDMLVGQKRCKKLEDPRQQTFRSLRMRLAAV
jgi:hypothetical protein